MLLARVQQQSVEIRRYDVSYVDRLRTLELIDTISGIVIAPVTATPLAVDSYVGSEATSVLLYVSGGEHGTSYTIQVRITTDDVNGVLWEDEIELCVEDI